MRAKCIAERAADTGIMIAKFSELTPGTDVSYDTIGTWLGREVRTREDLPTFNTVDSALRNQYGIELKNDIGVGYHLMTAEEIARDDSEERAHQRRARRWKKKLGNCDTSQLNETDKLGWCLKLTKANVIEVAASDKANKKLAGLVNGAAQPVAISVALEALKPHV